MKKSLIAVAALAAVGAASAQSSVTLYGVVDTGFGVQQTKTTTYNNTPVGDRVTKDRTTGVGAVKLSTSRFGLKGQEDLGNGLSAVFNLEAGFDSGSGKFQDSAFNRRSVVGLRGNFGQVLLGRDWTPMDSIASNYQASDLVTGDSFDALEGGLYTDRLNGIHYTGEWGGFGVKASVGYHDRKGTVTDPITGTSDVRSRDEGYAVGVSYAGGPFTVGAAVQQFRSKTTTSNPLQTQTTKAKRNEYGVAGTYDFTAAKLHAHYIARDGGFSGLDTHIGSIGVATDSGDMKPVHQFGVGVTVPFGAFTLGAQYAYNYHKHGSLKAQGHDYVLQGVYALSKRTDLYAQAARTDSLKVKFDGATQSKAYTDRIGVGIRHRF